MVPRKIEITPSILAADFRNLEEDIRKAENAGADRIHCDVMDGYFVPNISFGPMVIEAAKRCVSIPLDVHLMVHEPIRYVDAFCNAGADTLTVHAEACSDIPSTLEKIRNHSTRVGVTVNPDIGIESFLPYLDGIDQVLIMTVRAGFGGQKFIPEMLDKINAVFDEARAKNRPIDIQVDGGIDHLTAGPCARRGANVFVAGTYIFHSNDYRERIDVLRSAAHGEMIEW